jgi:formate hydrogenlyase transcriptional activator
MNKSSKTNQQFLLEIEELRARLDVSQQRLQEANEWMQAEMTECRGAEQVLEERLKFETLLAELSAHIVNLPTDRVNSDIEDAQRCICEFLDLDRSTLWQVPEREPGTMQKVLGGKAVTISKITDLPPEAGRDRESFRAHGTKSGVYVPLSVGEGPAFGLLGFGVMREERSWSER